MAKRAAAGTLALAVCLTGGAALASSAQAAAGFKFDIRLAGADRYQTAVEASKAAFPDGSDSVVIVNGDRTVDGLTASYVAGLHGAPILYVNSDGSTVSTETAAEIVRLKATKAYIVGGTTVVSASLEAKLKVGGGTVIRYGGVDRFETASLVAGSGSTKPSKVFVASGERFADALVAGPVAYKQHYPILLTSSTGVPSYTKAALADISAKDVKVVGGTAVVSASTYTAVGGTVRLAGDSRQGTATELADDAIKNEGFSKADVALVGNLDRNAADALVAAPFAGIHKTPLLFIDAGYAGAPTDTYLKAHAADLTGKGYVFGGTTAVPQDDADDATKAAAGVSVSVQGFIVTRSIDGAKLWYADPAQKAAVSVTLTSENVFYVDGNKATIGVFEAALSAGDVVSSSKDSSGVITYKLTNKTSDDYSSGFVGAVDSASSTASIEETVAGTVLNSVSFSAGTYRVFSVDGQAVSQSIFAGSVSVGDSISVTGDGSSATNIQTVALKTGSVSGVVAGWNGSGSTITFTLDSGVTLTVPVPTVGDTMTADGKSTTTVSDLTGALSNGDKITYSRSGGVASYALVNAAPPVAKGQIQSVVLLNGRLSTLTYVDATTHAAVTASNSYTTGNSYATTVSYAAGTPATAQVDTLTLAQSPWKTTAFVELNFGTPGAPNWVEVPVGGNQATFMANLKVALQTKVGGTRVATIAQGANDKVYTVTWDATAAASTTVASVAGIGGISLTVDGSLASASDVSSAITQGDTIVYQAPDVSTSTKASVDLVNASYSGSLSSTLIDTAGTATTLGVYASGSTSLALGVAVSYTATSVLGLSGTPTYSVNGVTKTQTQFEAALNSIKAGGATGTVTLTQSGTKLIWALTVSVS